MEQWSTPGSFAAWSSALNSQCEPTFLGGDPAALTSGGGGGCQPSWRCRVTKEPGGPPLRDGEGAVPLALSRGAGEQVCTEGPKSQHEEKILTSKGGAVEVLDWAKSG